MYFLDVILETSDLRPNDFLVQGGSWEFSKSGSAIHAEAASLGGVEKIVVEGSNWRVSDDTGANQ